MNAAVAVTNPIDTAGDVLGVLQELQEWVERRDYAGYEPFDFLNAPVFHADWARTPIISYLLIQFGKRLGGETARRILRVPLSKNPKALGLFLSGYADLSSIGHPNIATMSRLRDDLVRLRSPNEKEFCWGYDWDYRSLRGTVLPAFAMNAIATVFCAEALLDLAERTGDNQALEMAVSAGRACVKRLNRSYDGADGLCFSYTPSDQTRIYNSSALVGALLARLGAQLQDQALLETAKRTMNYLVAQQRPDGSWAYGTGRLQGWVDSFHSGYNLCAMLQYRRFTADTALDAYLDRGFAFYKKVFFSADGLTRYYDKQTYPIDIHGCAHAILTLAEFSEIDNGARALADRVVTWTVTNMRNDDGSFLYQRHRTWTNRTPYMRWGQAWMFRALARYLAVRSTTA